MLLLSASPLYYQDIYQNNQKDRDIKKCVFHFDSLHKIIYYESKALSPEPCKFFYLSITLRRATIEVISAATAVISLAITSIIFFVFYGKTKKGLPKNDSPVVFYGKTFSITNALTVLPLSSASCFILSLCSGWHDT